MGEAEAVPDCATYGRKPVREATSAPRLVSVQIPLSSFIALSAGKSLSHSFGSSNSQKASLGAFPEGIGGLPGWVRT